MSSAAIDKPYEMKFEESVRQLVKVDHLELTWPTVFGTGRKDNLFSRLRSRN